MRAARVALAGLWLWLLPAASGALLWSTLGVVDDGRTDNTAALNALPVGVAVEGDCPHGGVVLAQGVWLLRSHLFLRVRPGCEVLSNSTGIGSYAISQADPRSPLNNVTLIGLAVSKTTRVAGDRVLLAYIDNLQLLGWAFHHHGGAFFLRGSCQEVSGGRSYDAALDVGSPGVRHVGNVPKAGCLRPQPANVWVHDNDIVSGDGAYQACQPLDGALWANVDSDDVLFERNTGSAIASAFILVGLHSNTPPRMAFACTNVTFQHMQGSGVRLIYLQAGVPPNFVERVTFRNLTLDRTSGLVIVAPASIAITAVNGGAVRSVLMDGVRARGTLVCGLNATGTLEGVVVTNSELAAPIVGGGPNVIIDGGADVALSHSFIGAHNGDNIDVGLSAATQRTAVVNCTLGGVNSNRVGIALGKANASEVRGNVFSPAAGAENTTGIEMDARGAYAGTTDAAIHGNDVRLMAVGVVCGRGAGNNCSGNPGAKDC